jgi:subtilisin family serine protease
MARRARTAPRFEPLEPRLTPSTTTTLDPAAVADGPLRTGDQATTVLVHFDDAASATARADLDALSAFVVQTFPDGPSVVSLGQAINPTAALAQLRKDPGVVYAEADGTIHVDAIPNDPGFVQQWGLTAINAPAAWDITTGSPSVVIALIDSGVDLTNPDIAPKVWTNPVPTADGYPNDFHGWNFVNNTANIQDDNGHGTHVAGIMAAASDNAYGVAGVDWGAHIMPLKTIDAFGNGSVDAAVSAIYYAVAHGAKVINASWSGPSADLALENAISYANSRGVVFVTAAGNESVNNDMIPSYPANYDTLLPNVLSVAAVDQSGNLADFSNYGASTVGLGAPGVNILSTYLSSQGGFTTLSGTSMATPFVSGVVALLAGEHPEYTAAQLVQRILATVTPEPGLRGLTVSGGMVNAAAALGVQAANTTTPPSPVFGLPPTSPGTGGGSTTTSPNIPTASGIQPLAPDSSADAVRATILASDEYDQAHGGNITGFVTGLYQDLLGRAPDPTGLALWSSWLAAGRTRLMVVQAIQGSPEAAETKVARWFQTDLGRPGSLAALKADPGLDALAGQLLFGASDDSVRAEILASPEFLADNAYDPTRIVSSLYFDLLGRPADPAGLFQWASLLEQGAPPAAVVAAIQASPEAHLAKVAAWFRDDLLRPATLPALEADPGVASLAAVLA